MYFASLAFNLYVYLRETHHPVQAVICFLFYGVINFIFRYSAMMVSLNNKELFMLYERYGMFVECFGFRIIFFFLLSDTEHLLFIVGKFIYKLLCAIGERYGEKPSYVTTLIQRKLNILSRKREYFKRYTISFGLF